VIGHVVIEEVHSTDHDSRSSQGVHTPCVHARRAHHASDRRRTTDDDVDERARGRRRVDDVWTTTTTTTTSQRDGIPRATSHIDTHALYLIRPFVARLAS